MVVVPVWDAFFVVFGESAVAGPARRPAGPPHAPREQMSEKIADARERWCQRIALTYVYAEK